MSQTQSLSDTTYPLASMESTLAMDPRMERLSFRFGVRTSSTSTKIPDVPSVQNPCPQLSLVQPT